jgi:type VI secretion system protein ImpH
VVLGERVWSCQHKFRILLGALTRQQYLGMLPGSSHLPKLVAIVRNYLGDEYVWDVQLILQHAEVPAELALGKPVDQKPDSLNGEARLGWSMWLGPRHVNRDANDLMLNPFIQFNE